MFSRLSSVANLADVDRETVRSEAHRERSREVEGDSLKRDPFWNRRTLEEK